MMKESEVYHIGTLTRVHGLRGEVNFSFTDDVWDRVDASYLVLRVDGILVPFFMEEYRFRSDTVALVKFLDIESADEAQEYVGCEVFFPYALTPDEAPDSFRGASFRGFRIQDEHCGLLGTVTQVDDSTSNVLFYVQGEKGERMIPAVEDFIVDIDYQARTVTMCLPEGLLELNE